LPVIYTNNNEFAVAKKIVRSIENVNRKLIKDMYCHKDRERVSEVFLVSSHPGCPAKGPLNRLLLLRMLNVHVG